MSQDLPVQDAPLYLDETLNGMLSRYMEEKPYKLVKQVVEAIKPVERKMKNAAGEDEMRTVYALPRATALYLLNQVMAVEEMAKTYMFIRQGYEQAIANDRELAAKLASEQQKAARTKEKTIREIPVDGSESGSGADNISGPTIEPID